MYPWQQLEDIAELHINSAKAERVADNNQHGIKD